MFYRNNSLFMVALYVFLGREESVRISILMTLLKKSIFESSKNAYWTLPDSEFFWQLAHGLAFSFAIMPVAYNLNHLGSHWKAWHKYNLVLSFSITADAVIARTITLWSNRSQSHIYIYRVDNGRMVLASCHAMMCKNSAQ